jgi:hypothetical protein
MPNYLTGRAGCGGSSSWLIKGWVRHVPDLNYQRPSHVTKSSQSAWTLKDRGMDRPTNRLALDFSSLSSAGSPEGSPREQTPIHNELWPQSTFVVEAPRALHLNMTKSDTGCKSATTAPDYVISDWFWLSGQWLYVRIYLTAIIKPVTPQILALKIQRKSKGSFGD